jgi:fumarate hydratase class II
MNANEVIAHLAADAGVHPNDHVNMGQSSNDVIPTAIHVAACLQVEQELLPAMRHLAETITRRAWECEPYVKTGRTHLMDAMPVRLSQELGGWAAQVEDAVARIESSLPRLRRLALGGTAVGTGINAHPQFGAWPSARASPSRPRPTSSRP